jgi:hypothetical protein
VRRAWRREPSLQLRWKPYGCLMAELVGKLIEKLHPKAVSARTGEEPQRRGLRPRVQASTSMKSKRMSLLQFG